MSITEVEPKPFVREARLEDFEAIVDVAEDAFLQDPLINYFGSATQLHEHGTEGSKMVRDNMAWMYRSCISVGGRTTVAVIPATTNEDGSQTKEQIAAIAMWLPPNQRISVLGALTTWGSGLFQIVRNWGWSGIKRMVFEYFEGAHALMEKGFKDRNLGTTPDATWYLQLIGTHSSHQGKGLMSLLMREAYAHAPDAMFTLESTTTKSRDRYQHLGYEVLTPLTLGVGSANALGLAATGEEAVGTEIYCMVNRNPQQKM
ncbi:hypothetical protein BDQ17DRAFT_1046137 [Cyathus striatus]|nr:hypothetical protein BDQ17DRAFT_1046137 [Cyathus striatus]